MKKIISTLMVLGVFFACKQNSKEKKEEEAKIDSTVNTILKSDKEKADSLLKYYQNKIDAVDKVVPEMPAQ